MAAYFQEAGSKVTVIEMMDKVLGPNDREVSLLLQQELEKKGVTFYLSSGATKVANGVVTFTRDGKIDVAAYDKALMCVGRRANSNIEGLAELGIQVERGAIVTDAQMRTNVPNVYAIGDVNGKVMLAHVGYREGEVAVNTILGVPDTMSYDAVCGVVYTSPEAAFVGMSVFIGAVFAGTALMSSYASEYIYSLALMIENKIPLESIKRTIFPHPTVCEVIRETLFS